jgi:hypothetical protein
MPWDALFRKFKDRSKVKMIVKQLAAVVRNSSRKSGKSASMVSAVL